MGSYYPLPKPLTIFWPDLCVLYCGGDSDRMAVLVMVSQSETYSSCLLSPPPPCVPVRAHSSLMFQAFRSVLTVSFDLNFCLPLGRFSSIFISTTARMFSVSSLLLTCKNHSCLKLLFFLWFPLCRGETGLLVTPMYGYFCDSFSLVPVCGVFLHFSSSSAFLRSV